MSGQILREYLAVATRPADSNGLGLKPAEAAGNGRAIRKRTALPMNTGDFHRFAGYISVLSL